MLYAIALECAVLPTTGEGELRHRLSQRVAKLMAKTVDGRLEHQKVLRTLYDVRSKIVHSGHYEVNDAQLQRIRGIAKRTILALLTDTKVAQFRTPRELEDWYERRILGG